MAKKEEFVSTGIEKLDKLLEGGTPRGYSVLILGTPGSSIEILSKQLAATGKVMYFTTEETEEELKETSPDLFNKLEVEFGEVKTIIHTVIKYVDTGSVKNKIAKLDGNSFALNSNYYSVDSSIYIDATNIFYANIDSTNSSNIKLNIKSGTSKYNKIEFKTGFTTGIKKTKNGTYNIFLTPDSKSVVVTELKGADVSNYFLKDNPSVKRKRFSIGPYLGYGAVFAGGNKVYHGISVGVSYQYSIFNF